MNFRKQRLSIEDACGKSTGRQMNKIAKRKEKLFARIEKILNANIADGDISKMAILMTGYFQNTVEENVELLKQLKQGFTE